MPMSEISVEPRELVEAIKESLNLNLGELRVLIDNVPPELATDILEDGIYFFGGESLLKGLQEFIHQETGLKCQYVKDPFRLWFLAVARLWLISNFINSS